LIPFGPFRPDAASINTPVTRLALNVLPAPAGFKPMPGIGAVTDAMGSVEIMDAADNNLVDSEGNQIIQGYPTGTESAIGAAIVYESDGTVHSFAGTDTALRKLASNRSWDDVSRPSPDYTVGAGERWNFEVFGDLVLAVTISETPQAYDLSTTGTFDDLAGTPPKARYIAVVRDFVLLGNLENYANRVHWSGINDAEQWTPGTASSDYQDFPSGGPVRGLLGGEVGYVFQAQKIWRMTFQPGSAAIFSFDELEGGRGLAAPQSLVRIGRVAYYMAYDGFYKFDVTGGSSTPLGEGKWQTWVSNDIRPGTEQLVLGGVDPSRKLILWAYIPSSSASQTPTRILIYNWVLDEATLADVPVQAMAQWLSQGYSLDELGVFGDLDSLPFSLDSPVWKGGVGLLAIFGSDNKLSYLIGSPMAATVETADGQSETRTMINATRPHVDTAAVTVSISARERDANQIVYNAAGAMEDTGLCPAYASGNLIRAKIEIPEGSTWSLLKGIQALTRPMGRR
jgi:hypothetical protein